MTEFHTLDEVMAELEERDRRHDAKLFVIRKAIEFGWWVRRTAKYPPRPQDRVRFALQRIRRGYSERDWWAFDDFLAEIIIDGCRKFREEGHGHPADITWDEWCEILTKIEDGFKAHLELARDFPDKDREEELKAQFEVGGELFLGYFGSLWD